MLLVTQTKAEKEGIGRSSFLLPTALQFPARVPTGWKLSECLLGERIKEIQFASVSLLRFENDSDAEPRNDKEWICE